MSTDSTAADARSPLRKAIAERNAAKAALETASAAAQRGLELLQAAEAKLRAFGDVDAEIVRHRAASYKSAAQGGAAPTLELPAELLRRERCRDEARSAVAAAKAASASLAGDAARAERAFGLAEGRVSESAVAILTTAAIAEGGTLLDTWNRLWGTVDNLNALRSVFAVQLPRDVIRALQYLQNYDHRQFPGVPGNVQLARARETWRAWHDALLKSADAERPEEPGAKQAA